MNALFVPVDSLTLPEFIKVGSVFRSTDDEIVRYVPERTCNIDGGYYDEILEFQCTYLSCGHEVKGYVEYGDYCPKCGAKVVSE